MIFFVANDGTVMESVPSPVYQGAANANNIYLVAPFASNLQATVAFKLPNGVLTEQYAMKLFGELEGVINKQTGKSYSGWQFSMPNEITRYYGVVTAQFFFYSAESMVVTATSSVRFTVGCGVPELLPNAPTADIYEAILSNLSALQQQLDNGSFAARAIYAWNSTYTYGAGELVFYPQKGTYGVFLKSLTDNNKAEPYVNGVLDTNNWLMVSDFNILTELYTLKGDVLDAVSNAAQSAQAAGQSANAAASSSQQAEQSATNAENAAQRIESQAQYLEAIKDGTVAVPKATSDGSGNDIANQFAVVTSDITGLREDISNEAHFRGMFESVAALEAAYPTATPNDYAYIVGGNQYIYQNGAWADSGEPSPNTAVPASNATPLMDGEGSAGTSNEYARGDHRHPSDTSKLSLTDLKAFDRMLLEAEYPVAGSKPYIQYFGMQTPAERWAGTTWVIAILYSGKTIIGSGGGYTFATVGGAATHTLTIEEMPAHQHGLVYGNIEGSGEASHLWVDYGNRYKIGVDRDACEPTGQGRPFSTMPPYIVANIWLRTA